MSTSQHRLTFLITGTSAGFGLALAQHVLSQSYNLISISRHSSPDPSLTTLISSSSSSSPPILHHIPLDLSLSTARTTISSTLTALLANNPSLTPDILINNAAIVSFAPLETFPAPLLDQIMTVNFHAPLWLIQTLLPFMRNAPASQPPTEKVVVNISSTQGLACDASELAYESSKFALEGMSGVLAKEVAPFGIRVLVVNLGSLRTGFATRSAGGNSTGGGSGGANGTEAKNEGEGAKSPYDAPSHPVQQRIGMCRALAEQPGLARGDPTKAAEVLIDAVLRREGSEADRVLGRQREAIDKGEFGGVGRVERLVLGSDAMPKLERAGKWLSMQIGSCETVSGMIDAEGVKPLGSK